MTDTETTLQTKPPRAMLARLFGFHGLIDQFTYPLRQAIVYVLPRNIGNNIRNLPKHNFTFSDNRSNSPE